MTVGSLDAVVVHAGSWPVLQQRLRIPTASTGSVPRPKSETAFAALVLRHGRLVHFVCRQILRQQQDVKTPVSSLLVLAIKASAILRRNSLSVGFTGLLEDSHECTQGRSSTQKHEQKHRVQPVPSPDVRAAGRELQAIVAEEVERLAEKYRAPFCFAAWKVEPNSRQPRNWAGRREPSRAGSRQRARFCVSGCGVAAWPSRRWSACPL